MNYVVYSLTDNDGKIFYIGKARNARERFTRHLSDARNGIDYYVQRKIRKLEYRVKMVILESGLTSNEASQLECQWIRTIRILGVRLCNLTDGGDGTSGLPCSEERKRKVSLALKGKKLSKEHITKLKFAWKTRTLISKHSLIKRSKTSSGKINIKRYRLLSPDGKVFETIRGLADFCREHLLTRANLMQVVAGKRSHHKGWSIEKIS